MGDARQAGPHRVFISYRRTDSAYPTGWLYDHLAERFGDAQVFKDVDSIGPGDDFVDAVTRAVSMCDVLLAVIGSEWLSTADTNGGRRIDRPDDFVRIEIETALRRKVRVIPVLVDGAVMPTADQVPSSLAGLTRRQAIELSPTRFNTDLATLVRAIESTWTAPSPPPGGAQARGPREPGDTRPPWSQPQPARPPERAALPRVIAALVCAAVGAVLMLLGAGEPLLTDGFDLFSGTTQQDIQHAVPSVVLLASVLFIARPAVSASWLVGAAVTVLTLDYASTTLWVGLYARYQDQEIGVGSVSLRTAGAAFVLIAALVATPAIHRSRPPVGWPAGIALAAASALALVGAAGQHFHLPEEMSSTAATIAAAAPTAVFLLAVGGLVGWSHSAAAAGPLVTAAGGNAALLAMLELMVRADQDLPERGNVILTVVGLSVLAGVGVWLWVAGSRSRRTDRVGAIRSRSVWRTTGSL